MDRREAAVTAAIGAALALFVLAGLRLGGGGRPRQTPFVPRPFGATQGAGPRNDLPGATAPPDSPELVIGPRRDFLGAPAAAYTLVEFGDYSSAVSARAFDRLRRILPRYGGSLKLAFRNFPRPAHPDAQRAAVAAESARALGRFWPMHDALFRAEGHLTEADVSRIEASLGMDRAQIARAAVAARSAVSDDIGAARMLGVSAAPTFFLCSPDEPKTQILSVDQVNNIITDRLRTGRIIAGVRPTTTSIQPAPAGH